MKLLIVDDEIRLCRLIDHLIDWNQLNLTSIGYCHDGLIALQAIEEKRPDIVITDIRMPNCSGLELIETVKIKYPEIHIIVISGHSDFAYAQSAIKFGVEDYLLKPIRQIELKSALQKIIQKHQEQQQKEMETNNLKTRLDIDTKKIRSNFLEKLLRYPDSLDSTMELEEVNKNYGCNFKNGFFQLAFIHFLSPSDLDREKTINFFNEKVFSSSQILFQEYHDIITYQNQNIYAFLINDEDESSSNIVRGIRKIRTTLRSYSEFLENARIYFYVGGPVTHIREIKKLPLQTVIAGYQRFFNSPLSIIEMPEWEEYVIKDYLPERFLERFAICLESFNVRKVPLLVQELLDYLQQINMKKGYIIKDIYQEMLQSAAHVFKTNGISGFAELQEDLEELFENSYDYIQMFQEFHKRMTIFLTNILSHQHMENAKPIREAREYISSHYRDPVTLEIVGNQVGLSPVYLSSLFKKETGVSFVDYVTEVRIGSAKQMLIASSATVLEIAENTGFNDMKYFSKTFKKLVGLSPSEYRKLYS